MLKWVIPGRIKLICNERAIPGHVRQSRVTKDITHIRVDNSDAIGRHPRTTGDTWGMVEISQFRGDRVRVRESSE